MAQVPNISAQNGLIKFILFLGDVKAKAILDKAEDMDGTTHLYIAS